MKSYIYDKSLYITCNSATYTEENSNKRTIEKRDINTYTTGIVKINNAMTNKDIEANKMSLNVKRGKIYFLNSINYKKKKKNCQEGMEGQEGLSNNGQNVLNEKNKIL